MRPGCIGYRSLATLSQLWYWRSGRYLVASGLQDGFDASVNDALFGSLTRLLVYVLVFAGVLFVSLFVSLRRSLRLATLAAGVVTMTITSFGYVVAQDASSRRQAVEDLASWSGPLVLVDGTTTMLTEPGWELQFVMPPGRPKSSLALGYATGPWVEMEWIHAGSSYRPVTTDVRMFTDQFSPNACPQYSQGCVSGGSKSPMGAVVSQTPSKVVVRQPGGYVVAIAEKNRRSQARHTVTY